MHCTILDIHRLDITEVNLVPVVVPLLEEGKKSLHFVASYIFNKGEGGTEGLHGSSFPYPSYPLSFDHSHSVFLQVMATAQPLFLHLMAVVTLAENTSGCSTLTTVGDKLQFVL